MRLRIVKTRNGLYMWEGIHRGTYYEVGYVMFTSVEVAIRVYIAMYVHFDLQRWAKSGTRAPFSISVSV